MAPTKLPRLYTTAQGSLILVGRNAVQNEQLTASALGTDMWFHCLDVPGSHVILRARSEHDLVSRADMVMAAELALFYSQAPDKYNGYVEYCKARHVAKVPGSKTGEVIAVNTTCMRIRNSRVEAVLL